MNIKSESQHYHHLILTLLLFSLIFTFPFAGKLNIISLSFINLYAFRILLLLSFMYLLFTKNLVVPRYYHNRWLLFFTGWLLIYGLISLFWVDNKIMAFRQISYVVWGGLTFMVIFSICYRIKNAFRIIKTSWLLSFIILAFFALIEIGTFAHFEGTFTKNLAKFDFIRNSFNSPLATFGNPNDYAVFLVFSLIIFFLRLGRNKRLLPIFFIFLTLFILYYTRSVLSTYAIYYVIVASAFLFLYTGSQMFLKIQLNYLSETVIQLRKNWIRIMFITAVFLLSFIFIIVRNTIVIPVENSGVHFEEVEKSDKGFELIKEKMTDFYLIESEPAVEITETESYNIRKNLILNGWHFALESWFMGIGAGQFEHKVLSGEGKFNTMNKGNPHNFTIEVLSQYGIIPLILLAIFFMKIALMVLKNFRQFYDIHLTMESSFLFLSIPAYLLVSNGPSAFISLPMNWIILTLIAYSAETLMKNKASLLIKAEHE